MHVFSISFFFVGIEGLYALRDVMPFDKSIFTYFIEIVILLLLPNYKNLFRSKFYTNVPILINFIIIYIILIIFVNSYLVRGMSEQTLSLLILVYMFFALFSLSDKDFFKFDYYIFYLSSISTFLAWLLTPTSIAYWLLHGGRFYVSDTLNSALTANTAMLSIITSIIVLSKNNNKIPKIVFIVLILLDLYLILLSQSKTVYLSIFLVIGYLWIQYKLKWTLYIKFLIGLIVILLMFMYFLPEKLDQIIDGLVFATSDLVGIEKTHTQITSGAVRNEHFEIAYEMLSLSNIFGYGINHYRMDSPFLQLTIDFGNIMGVLYILVCLLIPLLLISLSKYKDCSDTVKLSILLYIFNIPNLFFHGTPYEYSVWLSTLLLYKVVPISKYKIQKRKIYE